MITFFKFTSIFIFILFLSSCSTQLKYKMQNSNFLTPESQGGFLKGEFSLSYEKAQKVLLAETYDTLIFNLPTSAHTSNSLSQTSNVSLPLSLGLLKQLDFYTIDEKYGFKYQFIGSTQDEKKEEFKAALAFGYGYDNNSEDATYTNSGYAPRIYSTEVKLKSYNINLLTGYRLSPAGLIYLNLFYDTYSYNAKLSSNQFSTISTDGKSLNTGLILGAQSNWNLLVSKVEAGIVQSKLINKDSLLSGTFGFTVGINW